MFRQNCSNNQSLAEHSDILFSYTLLIINVIVHPFNAFSMASMASVLAFSAMPMESIKQMKVLRPQWVLISLYLGTVRVSMHCP